MTHFDAAAAAVQAALDAGARYADARVMHRRSESMSARNGEIEELSQDEDAGVGVRALVGSGWGFYAVPDMSDAAARAAGTRAAQIAAASARVPGPATDLVPLPAATGSWASPCEVDPLGVPLSDKGDLLVGLTTTMREHGADLAEGSTRSGTPASGSSPARATGSTSTSASAAAASPRPSIGDGETQRRSYPATAASTAPAAGSWSTGARPARATRRGSPSEARALLDRAAPARPARPR